MVSPTRHGVEQPHHLKHANTEGQESYGDNLGALRKSIVVNGKLTKSEIEQLVMGVNHILGGLEVKVVLATMKEGGTNGNLVQRM